MLGPTELGLTGVFLLAVCGGLGALARFGVDSQTKRWGWPLGWSVTVINIVGSALAALCLMLLIANPVLVSVLTVGFCGGFTTFSTACLDLVTLWREGERPRAVGIATVTAVGSVLAVLGVIMIFA